MLLYTRVAPPKIPKRRSRTGCVYCKNKKKKCNEVRPSCSRCLEKNHPCIYEPVKPRQRKRSSVSIPAGASPFDFSDDNDGDSEETPRVVETPKSRPGGPVEIKLGDQQQQGCRGQEKIQAKKEVRLGKVETLIEKEFPVTEAEDSVAMLPDVPMSPSDVDLFSTLLLESGISSSMLASLSLDFDLHFNSTVFPPLTSLNTDPILSSSQDFLEPTAPGPLDMAETLSLGPDDWSDSLTLYSSLSFSLPSFNLPPLSSFLDISSRRHLIVHFANVISPLLTFTTPLLAINPFQQLILPLCQRSLVVTNAVYAMASAHLEHRGVSIGEPAEHFHEVAIRGLAKGIEKGGMTRGEMLGAIILLVYYEVLVRKGRTRVVDDHLRGALTVMTSCQATGSSPDPTEQFLERAFLFYDVISALSLNRAPLTPTPHLTPLSLPLPQPLLSPPLTTPIDSLLGLFTTLWPLLHRLTTFTSLKATLSAHPSPILAAQLSSGTTALLTALTNWAPDLPPDIPPSALSFSDSPQNLSPSPILSILHNALAYRHAATLHLHLTLLPRKTQSSATAIAQHTTLTLYHCQRTVTNNGPLSALLWPLFVAACEARTEADQKVARGVFAAVERRQGMVNIGEAWRIVERVWERGATGCGGEEWRRVGEEMGMRVVFG